MTTSETSGTRVRGRVSGDGDLVILGQVEGEITMRGDLTIGQGGSVTSNVEVRGIEIAGSLEGAVNASGDVHISSGARVRGDMRGAQIAIDEGAEFAGRLDCDFELPAELQSSR